MKKLFLSDCCIIVQCSVWWTHFRIEENSFVQKVAHCYRVRQIAWMVNTWFYLESYDVGGIT